MVNADALVSNITSQAIVLLILDGMAASMASTMLTITPLLICGGLALAFAIFTWRRSTQKMRRPFILIMLSLALLSFTYLGELTSPTLEGKLVWNDFEYLALCSMVPLYLVYIFSYTGRERVLTHRNIALLLVIPAATLILVATNDLHHLYYQSITIVQVGALQSFAGVAGPGYYIWAVYMIVILVLGWLFLFNAYHHSRATTRRQVGMVWVALSLPFIGFLLDMTGLTGTELTYTFILTFTGTGFICFVAILKYNLFEIVPLAIDKVVESMEDGVVVIDEVDRLVYANPAALGMLGKALRDAIGTPVASIPDLLPMSDLKNAGSEGLEFEIEGQGVRRYVRLRAMPLRNKVDVITGQLLILSDITRQRALTDALRLANTKMDLLSKVTRHDIMNRLMVIEGSASMLQSGKNVDVAKNAQRISESAKAIRYQVDFAKEYQNMGIKEPSWKNVRRTFAMAKSMSPASLIPGDTQIDEIEILADDMLERVFYILRDNSVRHAKHLTSVGLHTEERGDALVLIYEDDGVGIPGNEKKAIFASGYGNNTGLGLHLAREILFITGISIAETGEPGKGARFEIEIPPGRWRRRSP
jgi:signal transduction histidine kinase